MKGKYPQNDLLNNFDKISYKEITGYVLSIRLNPYSLPKSKIDSNDFLGLKFENWPNNIMVASGKLIPEHYDYGMEYLKKENAYYLVLTKHIDTGSIEPRWLVTDQIKTSQPVNGVGYNIYEYGSICEDENSEYVPLALINSANIKQIGTEHYYHSPYKAWTINFSTNTFSEINPAKVICRIEGYYPD
ncbi:hypothetical protein [Leptospira kanakyensis]|uniref:hypothetical protein n=1 Tax=Leptospira kanakyensis TaxID=2484968 RepID=UPI00223CAD41|nr:hypothetical protein [Leptospira kanakyensis]MCW7480355.1 hypothetical protein [Leptospira kanakyensis]